MGFVLSSLLTGPRPTCSISAVCGIFADPGQLEQVHHEPGGERAGRDAAGRAARPSQRRTCTIGAADPPGTPVAAGRPRDARGQRHGHRHGRRDPRAGSSSRSSPPRRPGKGTGLGLATVYGIVAAERRESPSTASRARDDVPIYLPRARRRGRCRGQRRERPRCRGGGETILLVEDEDGVRALARGGPRARRATRVLEAGRGTEALHWSRSPHAGPSTPWLTDVVMPRMSGPELSSSFLRRGRRRGCSTCPGYTDDAVVRIAASVRGGRGLPSEALHPETLARSVREVILAVMVTD